MTKAELGKLGEKIAAEFLSDNGHRILAKNWHSGKYEADIIARDADNLVFVEVKSRNTDIFGHPASFVSRSQQLNLAEVAEAYLEQFPENYLDIRYDVVSVVIQNNKHTIEHFRDAFWPDNLGLFSQE